MSQILTQFKNGLEPLLRHLPFGVRSHFVLLETVGRLQLVFTKLYLYCLCYNIHCVFIFFVFHYYLLITINKCGKINSSLTSVYFFFLECLSLFMKMDTAVFSLNYSISQLLIFIIPITCHICIRGCEKTAGWEPLRK